MFRNWCDRMAIGLATLAIEVIVGDPDSARADVERDGYRSIQVNVDVHGRNMLGDAANEPSIAVDPGDPRRMAIGWRQFYTLQSEREAGWAYSRDGGHHWTFPGTLIPGAFGSDPVLDVTAEGVFFYVSIDMNELRLYRSLDGGMNWGDPYFTLPGFHDKPWIAIDRTGGPGHGHIYIFQKPTAGFSDPQMGEERLNMGQGVVPTSARLRLTHLEMCTPVLIGQRTLNTLTRFRHLKGCHFHRTSRQVLESMGMVFLRNLGSPPTEATGHSEETSIPFE